MFCYLVYNQCRDPTTPIMPKHNRFGLLPVRSPLLGESLLFSLPTGTKMFQFPAFASISINMDTSFEVGFPIRTSAGHRIFAPNRSFSQLITSFFASVSQGIRHAPFSRFFRDFVQYLYLLSINNHKDIVFICFLSCIIMSKIFCNFFPSVNSLSLESVQTCLIA